MIRRETQLNEGADALGQHAVIEIVYILEVIDWISLPVLTIDKHVVLEYSVKTHILKSIVLCSHVQLFLPGGPQTFIGAPSADNFAPEVDKRLALLPGIGLQMNGGVGLGAG